MDTQDLVPGGNQATQDAELTNVLLRSSAWADNHCQLRLGAHACTEFTRARPDRNGQLYLTPSDFPVRSVTGLAYGMTVPSMTALTDLSSTWVEDSRGIVISLLPGQAQLSSLQFGPTVRADAELFIEVAYVAGYCNTTLAAGATSGASSITVADPTGIAGPATGLLGPVAGTVARIWDPGLEEAITVTSSYTPGASSVPLKAPLANPHAAGVVVSEFPPEIRQAIICHAVAMLLREDATYDEPFPGSVGPANRRAKKGGKAGGLLDHACMLLEPFKRIR